MIFLLMAISVLFMIGVWISTRYVITTEGSDPSLWLVYSAFALMLLIRIILSFSITGYAPDVQTFQAWAIQAAKDLPGFYSSGIFADYPPGYLYVLFLIGKLKGLLLLGDDSRGFLVLTKMPAILADMAQPGCRLWRRRDDLCPELPKYAGRLFRTLPAILSGD
jgi:hypothetical protein